MTIKQCRTLLILLALLSLTGFCYAESTQPLITVSDKTNEILVTQNYIAQHPHGLPSWLTQNPRLSQQSLLEKAQLDAPWLQFAVTNLDQAGGEDAWLIEFTHPTERRINLIITSADQVIRAQQIHPVTFNNPTASSNQLFLQALPLTPNKAYSLWVQTEDASQLQALNFKVIKPTQLFFNELTSNHIFGIFFGVFIAMSIYNLFMLISTGNLAYLFYTLFIACSYLVTQTISGYSALFVLGSGTLFSSIMFQLSATLAIISGLLFVRYFITAKYYFKYFSFYTNAMIMLGLAIVAFTLFEPQYSDIPQLAFVWIACLLTPVFVMRSWKKGSYSAGILLASWGLLGTGILIYLFQKNQLITSNLFTSNGILFGAASKMLLLSFGLADRINRDKKEKYTTLQQQHDVIVRLKEAEDRLMHRALHSRTTGLPNRTYLRNVLEDLITQKLVPNFSLVLLTLNNFHEFNKTLGHSNGDAILYLITERLIRLSDKITGIIPIERNDQWSCSVSAVEGVNFALIIQSNDPDHLSQITHDLLDQIEKPFEYDHLTLDVDAAAGIAMHPSHSNNAEHLMRNAHIALEVATSTNKKVAVYSPDIDPYNSRRISLLGELRNAIDNEELQLYLQPQVSLSTLKVKSAELLVRWNHPEYGFIPPDEFIPLAEKTGVIQPLTYQICKIAFSHKRRLDKLGMNIKLSINISARNLLDPKFKERVCELADEYAINLSEINMELTETAVMNDPDSAMKMMKDLSEAGIKLSIDDFGTGYSCLSYLKKLPVDEIKIDRSFVMDMVQNTDDKMIVLTTLTMGHNLSLGVVAEGIEDEPTLAILKEMGCDTAQGYHIAHPMPIDKFIHWLSDYQNTQEEFFLNSGMQT